MNCDQSVQALREAAAGGRAPTGNLAAHLEECATCQASFQREQALFVAIDHSLRKRVNEDPRASFLAELRVQISKETLANPRSNAVWAVTGATLAVVLIGMFYPLASPRQPRLQGDLQAATVRAPQSTEGTQPLRTFGVDSGVRSGKYSGKHSPAKTTVGQEPEVLVPPDEQRAFSQFVARVAGRDAMAEAVVSPAANKTAARNTELPEVPSVDIADLQLDGTKSDQWMDETGGTE
jgi:hypothetical protein